ncbi:MAG: transporter substrate-binding domain-containing protein [Planctomycetota bacterium]|nr:transporter substrate-binding domain-containing protein [Planctomycetota bacterium]
MRIARSLPLAALAVLALLSGGCDKDKKEEREDPKPQPKPESKPETKPSPESGGGNLERIRASKILRIGVKADSPPFCFQDKEGRPQGFDVDLGYRIARHLGVQPVFVTVATAERIEKLKKGEVDLIVATFTATRRRSREVDFSMPYFQDQQKLLVKADSPIQSYRDLSGKTVAVIKNSTSLDNIRIVAPDAKIVEVDSTSQGFDKLTKGEADAYTGDGMALAGTRLGAADAEKYRIAGEGFSVENYVVGLPRNDSELRNHVDEALTDLWNSGSWTRLFDKWLGEKSPYNMQAHFQMPVLPE